MESIDIIWTYHIQVLRDSLHTFNPALGGDNSMFLSVFPYSALAFVFNSAEALQKALFFLLMFLIALVSFSVFYFQIKKRNAGIFSSYLGATIGSVIYTINPNMVPNFFHYSYLWGYMLLPLIFHFTMQLICSKSKKEIFQNGLFLSLIFPFMADARAMFFGALLFIFLLIWHIVYQRSKGQLFGYLKKVFFGLLIVIVFSAVISAFWLTTYLTVKPIAYWAITSTDTIVSNSPPIFFAIANIWYPQPFFSPSGLSQSVWLAAIVVPVIASLAIIVKPKDRVIQTLSVLSIVTIFLSKGSSAPFGSLYLWLYSTFPNLIGLQSLFDMLMKYPSLFIMILCFSFSLLCALMVSSVFSKVQLKLIFSKGALINGATGKLVPFFLKVVSIKRELFAIGLVILILSSVAISSYPLVTGNMNGAVSPIELPTQYKHMNDYLVKQNGNFRTIFFPESSTVNWGNGFTNKPEYYTISTPVLSYGWGTVPSINMGFFGNFVYDSLLNNNTRNIGNIMSLANVKYLVYHNDTADSNQFLHLYATVQAQPDLQSTFSENNLFLFENTADSGYIYAVNSTAFVVGGLDSLSALGEAFPDSLNNCAWIFLEAYSTNLTRLFDYFEDSMNTSIILFGGKTTSDLLMDTINSKYSFAPIGYLTQTYPITAWSKETCFDYYWSQVVLDQFSDGQKYDFDLNSGIVFTATNDATLNIPVVLNESTVYETWIRLLKAPSGGRVSISIDGQEVGSIDSQSAELNGFNWENVGNVTLVEGNHDILIKNIDGFNAVNLLSLIPQNEIDDYVLKLNELISQSNLVSISADGIISGDIKKGEKLPFILNYKKISATETIVDVNASSPFMLIFSEPYNGLWVASSEGDSFSNIPVFSMMNGFWINKTGRFSITIEYAPEKTFNLGIIISVGAVVISILCIAILQYHIKRQYLPKTFRLKGTLE
jgi:hypothetical protein